MKALQIIDKGRNICWFMCKRTKNSKNYNHLKSVLGKNRMWKCLQKRKSCSVTSKKDWCWSWISSILSSDMNSWFIGKVSDAGKDWGQKEKRVSEDETAGWHHWCNGHELGQAFRIWLGRTRAAVHGVAKSWWWLGGWTVTVFVPHLLCPFLCWCTFKLLACHGYCT